MQTGNSIFNRINFRLINWDSVEEVFIHESGYSADIYFKSGRTINLSDHEEVTKLKEYIEMFPNILNKEDLTIMQKSAKKNKVQAAKILADEGYINPQVFDDQTLVGKNKYGPIKTDFPNR